MSQDLDTLRAAVRETNDAYAAQRELRDRATSRAHELSAAVQQWGQARDAAQLAYTEALAKTETGEADPADLDDAREALASAKQALARAQESAAAVSGRLDTLGRNVREAEMQALNAKRALGRALMERRMPALRAQLAAAFAATAEVALVREVCDLGEGVEQMFGSAGEPGSLEWMQEAAGLREWRLVGAGRRPQMTVEELLSVD